MHKMKHLILDLFMKASDICIKHGYNGEIEHCRNLKFENIDEGEFLNQYVWVVLSSGMQNQIAQKMYDKLIETGDVDTIKHPLKNKAIKKAFENYKYWFKKLKLADNKVEYLGSLYFIGDITKYHLARNLGIDVAKPDRHLVRLAEEYGFKDAHEMCKYISDITEERIGVVDVILWRYSNLKSLGVVD